MKKINADNAAFVELVETNPSRSINLMVSTDDISPRMVKARFCSELCNKVPTLNIRGYSY